MMGKLDLNQMRNDVERIFGYDVVGQELTTMEEEGLLLDDEQKLERALLLVFQSYLNCELEE